MDPIKRLITGRASAIRARRYSAVACALTALLFVIVLALSPGSEPVAEDLSHDVPVRKANPPKADDVTVAFFRFENGRQTIRAGKLHSYDYKELCIGAYPSASPSGKFVAFNPEGDDRFDRAVGIPPVQVVDLVSKERRQFKSFPANLAPWPCCDWSVDDQLIHFEIHENSAHDNTEAVLSLADKTCWLGTQSTFRQKFSVPWKERQTEWHQESFSNRVTYVSDPTFHHLPPSSVFYFPPGGSGGRLTPKELWMAGKPLWIEGTKEVIILGLWISEMDISHPEEKSNSPTPRCS